MSATVWLPMPRPNPRSWLLGNGETIIEPELEVTSSRRKVRVIRSQHSSYFGDLDQMLWDWASTIARMKRTSVHLEVSRPLEQMLGNRAGYQPADTKAVLHLVHDHENRNGKTTVWWRFKDTKTPFEVLLTAMMSTQGRFGVNPGVQQLRVALTVPCRTYDGGAQDTDTFNVLDGEFTLLLDKVAQIHENHRTKWHTFIQDTPPGWCVEELGQQSHTVLREGVNALLKTIRKLDALASIEVPDFGDPAEPSYRTLALYDTNYSDELVNDLLEYLDDGPTIKKAAEHYGLMLEALRGCGIVLDESKKDNDFMAALLAGNKTSLGIRIFNLAETEHAEDRDHTLSVHLPTGAFVVECKQKQADPNGIADRWEESLITAQLTGQEDALLAYARKVGLDHQRERTKQIFRERSKD